MVAIIAGRVQLIAPCKVEQRACRTVEPGGDVYYTQRMLEASVHRPRIHLVRPSELADAAQPLESRLRDDFSLPIVQLDEPVHRAADLVGAMRICHDWPFSF